jgi:arginyl-tRNA--protein-N-Asp/Glu arginylyltransferase
VPAEETVESFKLYQSYSKDIHEKKEKSMSSYVNFLCLQALEYEKQKSSILPENKQKYVPAWDPTSKHQQPKSI